MSIDIASQITAINRTLPAGVKLVAVSKFHPVADIAEAYACGQRAFGESRVQELIAKHATLPDDIEWHFIGHLQTNKVRMLIGKTSLIESVDSLRLLDLIDRESERAGIITRVLMQVHVAAEETKTGFDPNELLNYFKLRRYEHLKATHLCGIMGMATNTDDLTRIKSDFTSIRDIYNRIIEIAPDLRGFDTVSMGMSDDYLMAIECGSTAVRIGSGIFGPRG